MKKRFLFAVCGQKHTGKTTLIESLLKEFNRRGIQVAVVKHDGHDFQADREGTDTYRHMQAGACGTAVFSKNKMMLVKERRDVLDEGELAEKLADFFTEADLVLVEGLKETSLPKLEVVRDKRETICCTEQLKGVVTTKEQAGWWEERNGFPVWTFDQVEEICDLIQEEKRRQEGEADEI